MSSINVCTGNEQGQMSWGLSQSFNMKSQAGKCVFPLETTKTTGLIFVKPKHTQETNRQT